VKAFCRVADLSVGSPMLIVRVTSTVSETAGFLSTYFGVRTIADVSFSDVILA
jgi:hypothetical protein